MTAESRPRLNQPSVHLSEPLEKATEHRKPRVFFKNQDNEPNLFDGELPEFSPVHKHISRSSGRLFPSLSRERRELQFSHFPLLSPALNPSDLLASEQISPLGLDDL